MAEREEIDAAHPTHTGRHDLYAEAMRLVGERHAKGDLVELVNWLLFRLADIDAKFRDAEAGNSLQFDKEPGPKFALTVALSDGTTMELGFPYFNDESMLRGLAGLLQKPLGDILILVGPILGEEMRTDLAGKENETPEHRGLSGRTDNNAPSSV